MEEKFVILGTSSRAFTNTPTTEPTVLTKKTRPAPESLFSVGERKKEISIGFNDERKISGKASKIKLPIKLPKIRPDSGRRGNRKGYRRQEIKINNALSRGI